MNPQAHDRWNRYCKDSDSAQLRYPVRACPVCGRTPIFHKVEGRRHMEWRGFDYCDSTISDSGRSLSTAIMLWNEAARFIERDFEKANVSTYWKAAKVQRAIDKWDAEYAKLSIFKRVWLSITGNLTPRPVMPTDLAHVPVFIKEREYYNTIDPVEKA